MSKEFVEAFGTLIRDQIIMKNSVEIEGLGVFKAQHNTQRQDRLANGTTVMLPPSDTIEFSAEKKG
ncbi:MAG: HU family DNA-binding protein [Bacteroidota bacterium]